MCICFTVTICGLEVPASVDLRDDIFVGVRLEFGRIYTVVSISQIGIWLACPRESRLAVLISRG